MVRHHVVRIERKLKRNAYSKVIKKENGVYSIRKMNRAQFVYRELWTTDCRNH